jgi:hypothetical protein
MNKILNWIFKKHDPIANHLGNITHSGVGYTGSIVRGRIRDGKSIHHGVGYCGIERD